MGVSERIILKRKPPPGLEQIGCSVARSAAPLAFTARERDHSSLRIKATKRVRPPPTNQPQSQTAAKVTRVINAKTHTASYS
jgi:hypothetical protein